MTKSFAIPKTPCNELSAQEYQRPPAANDAVWRLRLRIRWCRIQSSAPAFEAAAAAAACLAWKFYLCLAHLLPADCNPVAVGGRLRDDWLHGRPDSTRSTRRRTILCCAWSRNNLLLSATRNTWNVRESHSHGPLCRIVRRRVDRVGYALVGQTDRQTVGQTPGCYCTFIWYHRSVSGFTEPNITRFL